MHIFAYLDAGTGSMFIQAVLGAALAIGVVFRSFIGRVITKIRRAPTSSQKLDEESE